jgi:cell division protein FtsB
VSIVVLILCTIFIFVFDKGGQYVKVRSQNALLTSEVEDLQKQNKALKDEIGKLKNDQGYIEEVARHEYGLLKKNEIVFDFNKKKSETK